jgi:hypothetical protein
MCGHTRARLGGATCTSGMDSSSRTPFDIITPLLLVVPVPTTCRKSQPGNSDAHTLCGASRRLVVQI